jgi:hypothetical protein
MKQLIAICVFLALINSALSKQTACGDEPEDVEYDCVESSGDNAQDSDAFYAAIKATMTSKNYTNYDRYVDYPDRVVCIVEDLKAKNAIATLNSTTFEFSELDDNKVEVTFTNITVTMHSLERMIQDASFDCQGMNTARMVFIVFLVILSIVCIALCIRVRLLRRVKWSSVEQQ